MRLADSDPAEFRELLDRRRTAETSPAAVFDAAERHLRLVAYGLVVDVDDARLDPLRERETFVGVARDDPRREPVRRRVRALDRLIGTVHDLDRSDRTERLDARKVGILGDVRQQ